MSKQKYEVEVVKEKPSRKEIKNIIVYKPSIFSSFSGLLILLMFIIICYMSVVKPAYFPWLLFGIVSLPIIRRNFNDISVIFLSLALIICATSGILINGLSEMIIASYVVTKPMAMGIAIFGLAYLCIVAFYKNLTYIDKLNIILFYLIVALTAYPIFIVCIFVGSLLGFLGVTMLKILIYCLLALPVILALYLIFMRKNKVIKSK